MKVITTIKQMKELIAEFKSQNLRIGFVPTMGYLHDGHAKLMQLAKQNCDISIVSIFINPLQFGANEDLERYPRDLQRDSAVCESSNVDVLFVPNAGEIVGKKLLTNIMVNQLGDYLCGASRPGHFNGVCVIVAKLFNIIQPTIAFFGKKDIQQLRIIQQMVKDLNFPLEVFGVDIVRDSDGLALSSRNVYLNAKERLDALIVPKVINYIADSIMASLLTRTQIIANAIEMVETIPNAKIDYIEIVDYDNLAPTDCFHQSLIVLAAIYIGKTRLIDNCILEL